MLSMCFAYRRHKEMPALLSGRRPGKGSPPTVCFPTAGRLSGGSAFSLPVHSHVEVPALTLSRSLLTEETVFAHVLFSETHERSSSNNTIALMGGFP